MAPPQTIDFHAHVFPLEPPQNPKLGPWLGPWLGMARRMARQFLEPATDKLHQAQVWMRHLPGLARAGLDQVGGIASIPHLLVESTPDDLTEAMDSAGVDQAVLIAHPPLASNEWVLQVCSQNPGRFFPVVNIPKGTPDPAGALREYVAQGARALKIHAAADGEGPTSERYLVLLDAVRELSRERSFPVILHTGCIQNRLFYRDPECGRAEAFAQWFEAYPEITFVLAHMNFHEPQKALELGELHRNVCVDTSWQPAEMVGEAVRRLGADRVLFGSDWPFVGGNLQIGKRRIQEGVDAGVYSAEDAAKVLGGNALRLLQEAHAPVA